MRFRQILLTATACFGSASAAQIPFLADSAPHSTAVVTQDGVRTLKHPALPAHTLRITQVDADLCERESRSFSGYMDVDVDQLRAHYAAHDLHSSSIDRAAEEEWQASHVAGTVEHFYFWAFESRNDPTTDPHVLWLNGGPGCSSFTGLLMELGPCNAADFNKKGYNGTEWNPWSWNSNATMIFLDQPVGVGFSHVTWADPKRKDTPPGRIYSTPAAARDAAAFLQLINLHAKDIFTSSGKKDKKDHSISSFHIAGESFGGRYIPLIGAQVVRDNADAARHPERGLAPVPLKSLMIGNGITSPKDQFKAYWSWACSDVSGAGPFLDEKTCAEMESKLPTCLRLTEKCNQKGNSPAPYHNIACSTAATFCEGALSSKWDLTNTSVYDYEHKATYDEEEWVAHFLNTPRTKKALGVDRLGPGDAHDGVFIGCSDDVGERFASTGDGARDSTWAVREVLDAGVRVLAYSGRRDFICNSQGNERWTLDLEWEGAEEFRKQDLLDWYEPAAPGSKKAKGRLAGQFRNFANFTFAIVDASGHFVPHGEFTLARLSLTRMMS